MNEPLEPMERVGAGVETRSPLPPNHSTAAGHFDSAARRTAAAVLERSVCGARAHGRGMGGGGFEIVRGRGVVIGQATARLLHCDG